MLPVADMNRQIMSQLDYRDLTVLSCVDKGCWRMVVDNEIWIMYLDRDYPTRERKLDFRSLRMTYQVIRRASLLDIIKADRLDLLKIKYPNERSIEDGIGHRASRILEYWLLRSPFSFEGYYRLSKRFYSTEQKRLIGRQLAELFCEDGRWEAIEMLSRFGMTLKGRYSRLLNRAMYRDDIEEVRRLILQGACPDSRAYDHALIENKTEILALLSKSGVYPTRKGIREALLKNGVEAAISLLLYRNHERTLKIALYQSAIRCKPAFKYLIDNHSFPLSLIESAKTISRRNP